MENLVLFGDSMLARMNRDLIKKIEDAVPNLQVHNCATGGFTSKDGALRALYIAKLQPDYVCLSFGANDANPTKGKPLAPDVFRKNVHEIVDAFSGADIIIFPCPPISDMYDQAATFNAALNEYYQELTSLALETNSFFIDSKRIYGKFLLSGKNYHLEDGLHLNEGGYQVFIEELVRVLL